MFLLIWDQQERRRVAVSHLNILIGPGGDYLLGGGGDGGGGRGGGRGGGGMIPIQENRFGQVIRM